MYNFLIIIFQVNLKDLVPISFKPDIEQGLMNGYLLPTQENAIIRYTCNNMKSKSKTSNSDISQMATFLLDMYPVLNSNTSVGISQVNSKISICRFCNLEISAYYSVTKKKPFFKYLKKNFIYLCLRAYDFLICISH